MNEHSDSFTILYSNINSIHAKFDELETIIELYNTHGFQFSVICFQECWISEQQDLSQLKLNGHKCIYQEKSCSTKVGIVIFLQERFNYKINLSVNTSDIWVGLLSY